jgi:nitrous oxidase accessory protein NosD
VTWRLSEGRHTVTSDVAKRFDSGAMESAGKTFTFRTPRTDVTLYYHCRIHGIGGDGQRWGSGMVGRIIVGNGSPAPKVPPDVDVRRVPSKSWPSLDRALTGLDRDRRYRIDLAPGTYRSRDITPASLAFREPPTPRFELMLRGAGARPGDVVFKGGDTGIGVSIDGLRIENVTFSGQTFAGVFIRAIDRWSVDDVVVTKPGLYGIWVDDGTHGRIRRVSVSGAHVAGIAVRGCAECDLLVDSVSIDRSLQGLSASGAGALVVRGSTFRRNGVGIALKNAYDSGTIHRGSHILVNTFRDNTDRSIEAPAFGPEKDMPVGAGVWIDGGSFDVVERNDLAGHSFGVVLTGPNESSRVTGNTISRSSEADVGWDGLGTNVCFGGNASPSGEAVTAMPGVAQDVYACDLPATVGVPYPPVTATVMAWGLAVLGP